MTGLQLDIEMLAAAAERRPGCAPWETTLGEAIDAWTDPDPLSAYAIPTEAEVTALRRRLAVWGFRRDMTLSDARKHAKAPVPANA